MTFLSFFSLVVVNTEQCADLEQAQDFKMYNQKKEAQTENQVKQTHIWLYKQKKFNVGHRVQLLSCVRLFATSWTGAHQAPLSMEARILEWVAISLCPWMQEYWSRLLFLPPGNLPNPGIEPRSPAFSADSLLSEPPGKAQCRGLGFYKTNVKCQRRNRQKRPLLPLQFTTITVMPRRKKSLFLCQLELWELPLQSDTLGTEQVTFKETHKAFYKSSQLQEPINLCHYFQKMASDPCSPVSSYESTSPWQSMAEFRSLETRKSQKCRSYIFSLLERRKIYKGIILLRKKQHNSLLWLVSIYILTTLSL